MNSKYHILLALCISVISPTFANKQVQFSGYVADAKTGERLIGANVYKASTKLGTATNAYGYFNLNIDEKINNEIVISYIGYTESRFSIKCLKDTMFTILLEPGREIDEVVIYNKKQSNRINEMGTTHLSMKTVKSLPALGGEHDLVKALQLLPGVQSGTEGSSALYVRGGSPDQNLVMIDDVPLYYVNHLGGFVSIFNPDIVNNVKLIKGGIPARYGTRLSSIVDIRMKEGNMKERKISGSVGLISMKLALEGPVKIDTSSYLISVRRFMYDILMRPFSKIYFKDYSLGYTFYDINAKYNHIFSPKNRIFLSFYRGNDKSTINIKNKNNNYSLKNATKWGNTAASFRWNHLFTSKLFSNITAYYTTYRHNMNENYQLNSTASEDAFNSSKSFQSAIRDIGLKIDFHYQYSTACNIKYGAGATVHQFTPSQTYSSESSENDELLKIFGMSKLNSNEGYSYFENNIKIGRNFNANVGLRYSFYSVQNKIFNSIEPRGVISFILGSRAQIKAGYTKMSQNVHLLSSGGMGIPADYWLPATSSLIPSVSEQVSVSFEYETFNGEYSWCIEPYFKQMNNLIEFKQGYSHLNNTSNWENLIETNGKGLSYGVELLITKHVGDFTTHLGYTLSKTTRQFNAINDGNAFPYKYDRLHDISMVFMYKINEHIDFSATWVYGSGNAFTLSEARYITLIHNEYLFAAELYSKKNAYRLRAYHHLDSGFNFKKHTKWGEPTISVNIYNLYNRKNPYFYFWDNSSRNNNHSDSGTLQLYQYSYFPIIPSVSYSFVF